MDWYLVFVVIFLVINTIITVMFCINYISISTSTQDEEKRAHDSRLAARLILFSLAGYVLVFMWPIAVPALLIFAIIFIIKKAIN